MVILDNMEQLKISYKRFSHAYVGIISQEGYILYDNEKYNTIGKFISHILQSQCSIHNFNNIKIYSGCGRYSLRYDQIVNYAHKYHNINFSDLDGEKKLQTINSLLLGKMVRVYDIIERERQDRERQIEEENRQIEEENSKKSFFDNIEYVQNSVDNFISISANQEKIDAIKKVSKVIQDLSLTYSDDSDSDSDDYFDDDLYKQIEHDIDSNKNDWSEKKKLIVSNNLAKIMESLLE